MTLPSHTFRLTYGAKDDRLHDFYLPALERSVLYRRSAGYFSSSALAIAAAGVARLVKNGGSMQFLCGADLAEDDVSAIVRGESLKSRVERSMLRRLDLDDHKAADADMAARLGNPGLAGSEGSVGDPGRAPQRARRPNQSPTRSLRSITTPKKGCSSTRTGTGWRSAEAATSRRPDGRTTMRRSRCLRPGHVAWAPM